MKKTLLIGLLCAGALTLHAAETNDTTKSPPEAMVLNYHLMHPGGNSSPGDPNAAFYLDGTYHLHYICNKKDGSFAFAHVSSPDMLNWKWHKTVLDKNFTGHGMFSGTGFITKEGRPLIIYHGQGSNRNQILIAKDNTLDTWEKPYPIEPANPRGLDESLMRHWDPDIFRVDDTYYAIFGDQIGKTNMLPTLMKSKDLKNWEYTGNLFAHDLPGVLDVEDVSCPNFFPIGNKWMLLCISHNLGARYYLGDWDKKTEKFVPQFHARMNWRREDLPEDERMKTQVFAPESVLTPDGRRVMWAWFRDVGEATVSRGIQTLPRELSLPADGVLRIKPLREMQSLRYNEQTFRDVPVPSGAGANDPQYHIVAELPGEAVEIRAQFSRREVQNSRFGFRLFAEGLKDSGFSIIFKPDTKTIRVGTTEAPFDMDQLPKDEEIVISIFVDKYMVEVFVNDRQAVAATYMDYMGKTKLEAYSYLQPITIKELKIWQLNPTNAGFLEALKSGGIE